MAMKLPDSVPRTRFTDYFSSMYSVQLTGGCELNRRIECAKHSHQLDVVGIHNNWDVNNASYCLTQSRADSDSPGFNLLLSVSENETFNFDFIGAFYGHM
jgi:hypothetical protein